MRNVQNVPPPSGKQDLPWTAPLDNDSAYIRHGPCACSPKSRVRKRKSRRTTHRWGPATSCQQARGGRSSSTLMGPCSVGEKTVCFLFNNQRLNIKELILPRRGIVHVSNHGNGWLTKVMRKSLTLSDRAAARRLETPHEVVVRSDCLLNFSVRPTTRGLRRSTRYHCHTRCRLNF